MRFFNIGLGMVLFLCLIGLVRAENISISAGHTYLATLVTQSDTLSWGGIIITSQYGSLSNSLEPFMSFDIDTPLIYNMSFPGRNFNDDNHYYMATLESNFDISQLRNISISDLGENKTFSSLDFPTFYPNYLGRSDGPNRTFCCQQEIIEVGGVNFSSLRATLENNVRYYLLNYGPGYGTPIFLTPIEEANCIDGSACLGEFMLPLAESPYYFYAINKKDYFIYNITIDGVYTRTIPQTALIYKLWVRVINAIDRHIVPNASVLVGEDSGQNIFIPYRLDGYISHTYSIGLTDENGTEEFLVAPTVYPTIGNYTLYVGVFQDGGVTSQEELFVTSKDSLIHVSKPLEPSPLYDNAKVSINAMNQINNYLFRWSSQVLQARKYTLTYELTTHNFTITETGRGARNNITLKTGAPNVLFVTVLNGGIAEPEYNVKIREQGGYLIMDPYTADSPFREKSRMELEAISSMTEFIVTPTSLGVIRSNVTLDVLNSTNGIIATAPIFVESSLDMSAGGVYYNNDLMKTIVNAMNSVLSSLFYSLNN
jgi:hypothetical protein